MTLPSAKIGAVIANTARSLGSILPGAFFPGGGTKLDYYSDFGYPENLCFAHFRHMYDRNPIANAAVMLTSGKTWENTPWLLEMQPEARETRAGRREETDLEKAVRLHFATLRVWQVLKTADERSLVGCYAGVILQLGDGRQWSDPVASVPGGLKGLRRVIPAWEGQLTVSHWVTDERDPRYGEPAMFSYSEASLGNGPGRSLQVHPDRVILWSSTGDASAEPFLSAGYNAALDADKVRGAGGAGSFKATKNGFVFEDTPDGGAGPATQEDLASAYSVQPEDVKRRLGEAVENFESGHDSALLTLGGIRVRALDVKIPNTEPFNNIALSHFAAACGIPVKILVGMQTGERASTEDARAWAKSCQGRRETETVPNVMAFVERLVRFGVLPQADWFLDWDKLTESGADEKLGRAKTMSEINENESRQGRGELVFTPDEIRETAGHEPLSVSDDSGDGDVEDAEDALDEDPDHDDEAANASGKKGPAPAPVLFA